MIKMIKTNFLKHSHSAAVNWKEKNMRISCLGKTAL